MAGYAELACRLLIGIVFAASAVSKLRSRSEYRAFAQWLSGLPLPGPFRGAAAAATVAATETAIVVLLIPTVTAAIGLGLSAVTLAAFATGTFVTVRTGTATPCRCFGASDSPMSSWHVARDALLALVAAGAALANSPAHSAGGVALSLAIAVTVAVPVVLFDDLLSVLRLPASR
jgi:Methylamine utilisation protein MauE